jgi:hypothetical protein
MGRAGGQVTVGGESLDRPVHQRGRERSDFLILFFVAAEALYARLMRAVILAVAIALVAGPGRTPVMTTENRTPAAFPSAVNATAVFF